MPLDRCNLFKDKFYLHYFNEVAKRFTIFEEEAGSEFGGLSFPGDPLFDEYPCGYKFWIPRGVHDAPDWVIAVKLLRK